MQIALFNRYFGRRWFEPPSCPPGVTFTYGPGAVAEADAVVFHLPTLDLRRLLLLPKRRGQVWVGFTQESPVMHPREQRWRIQRRIDLRMTYERSADVWMPYLDAQLGSLPLGPAPAKTAAAPAVWMVSNPNDRSGRREYGAVLGEHLRIDRFGAVDPNRTETIASGTERELYAKYKFTLAFENSEAPDYVTEKFWWPLAAGSVPVYRGTADVAALAPDPRSYVDARDFASPRELARYLEHLDHHEDEYAALHAWRSRPLRPSFAALLERLRDPWPVRLAAAIAAHRGRVTRSRRQTAAERTRR